MYKISKSNKSGKKFDVQTPTGKIISFGAKGYEDFTIHKDPDRKKRYIVRHSANETWTRRGINTPGFWSRWILWNRPTLNQSILDTEDRFNIKIKYYR
jgi:hypothetical protein